jgi:nitroreductase
MDAMECLLKRRSVRKFTADPIAESDLEKMLEAVRFAPSWANTQCVKLVLVEDDAIQNALQQTVPAGNPAHAAIGEAPLVVALCAQTQLAGVYKGQFVTPFGDWMMFDAGLAAQNLALAAHALGYATVNVGLMDQKKAGEILGLPEDVELLELLPVGRPQSLPAAPARKGIAELFFKNTYGEPLQNT